MPSTWKFLTTSSTFMGLSKLFGKNFSAMEITSGAAPPTRQMLLELQSFGFGASNMSEALPHKRPSIAPYRFLGSQIRLQVEAPEFHPRLRRPELRWRPCWLLRSAQARSPCLRSAQPLHARKLRLQRRLEHSPEGAAHHARTRHRRSSQLRIAKQVAFSKSSLHPKAFPKPRLFQHLILPRANSGTFASMHFDRSVLLRH